MQGSARTLRCEAIEKYRVPDDDFLLEKLLPWIVRHSSWFLSRFQIHTDENTSYQAIHGYVYSSQIFPFGQTVLVKAGRATHPTEIDWLDGIWVGRVSKSDEHLVLTERGTIYSRTVRPHPQGEHVREIFDKVRGLPWNPSGRVEPIVKPPPVQPPTSRQEYLREFGKTANCRACEGIRGRHHTNFCQDRFEAWQTDRGFSGVPTDQRDNVEKDPASEPAMTDELLDPEVAGSTLPPDRGRKRDETESDQPPAARRLVSKQGRNEMMKRRVISHLRHGGDWSPSRGRNVMRIKSWDLRAHISIMDLQNSYPAPTETNDNYRGEGEFDGVCVEENLDVDEIKKLAKWLGYDGAATEMAVMIAEAKSLSGFGVYEEMQSSDVSNGTRIIGCKIVLREKH